MRQRLPAVIDVRVGPVRREGVADRTRPGERGRRGARGGRRGRLVLL